MKKMYVLFIAALATITAPNAQAMKRGNDGALVEQREAKQQKAIPEELLPLQCSGNNCSRRFATGRGLNVHLTKYHKKPVGLPKFFHNEGDQEYQLSASDQASIDALDYSGAKPLYMQDFDAVPHRAISSKKSADRTRKNYTCTICSLTFAALSKIALHVQEHKDAPADVIAGILTQQGSPFVAALAPRKEYICQTCQKSCASKVSLQKHQLCHSEKMYGCSECDQTFKRRFAGKRHSEKQHDGLATIERLQ